MKSWGSAEHSAHGQRRQGARPRGALDPSDIAARDGTRAVTEGVRRAEAILAAAQVRTPRYRDRLPRGLRRVLRGYLATDVAKRPVISGYIGTSPDERGEFCDAVAAFGAAYADVTSDDRRLLSTTRSSR